MTDQQLFALMFGWLLGATSVVLGIAAWEAWEASKLRYIAFGFWAIGAVFIPPGLWHFAHFIWTIN